LKLTLFFLRSSEKQWLVLVLKQPRIDDFLVFNDGSALLSFMNTSCVRPRVVLERRWTRQRPWTRAA